MLRVRDIDVCYGDRQVLWGVSITVGEDELVALIGANGAGKSTLIKTVSGLLTPRKGTIDYNGRRLDRCRPHDIVRYLVVHVPEGRRLFPEMSVEENLLMGALHGSARALRTDTLAQVYDWFPKLKERRQQQAGTLSGGEQQMAAIGRGLMSRPELMMLDEPAMGLAPAMVHHIFETLRRIRKTGVSILLVEQNVKRTLDLCGRAYVLENGRIAMEGKASELAADRRIREAYLGI